MINIRMPNITGKTETEQLQQIKSFLHQLVNELNWALSVMEPNNEQGKANGTGEHK